jgi:hypothetical protein
MEMEARMPSTASHRDSSRSSIPSVPSLLLETAATRLEYARALFSRYEAIRASATPFFFVLQSCHTCILSVHHLWRY